MRRSDIQGLRAFGSLLVAIFHIFQWGVSGGVDVFLTVSGFFLWGTAIKLVECERGHLEHYNKFLKRTAPQAILVVLAVLVATFLFISPVEWSVILRDAAFSAVFLQNYRLAILGQDYLAREEGLSLFQHYWAVAVIAQVYFLFPVITLFTMIITKAFRLKKITTLRMVLSVTTALSLAWSLFFSSHSPEVAYFDTFSRFWQFGAGAIVASILIPDKTAAWDTTVCNVLSWVGLAAILLCGFVIGRSFPGLASIWPTLGALLILTFSTPTDNPRNAGFILSQKVVVWFGEISFGVYLWHWPIYAIYFRFVPEQTFLSAIIIIAGATILALLSTGLVAWLGHIYEKANMRTYGLSATSVAVIFLTGASCLALDRLIVLGGFSTLRHPLSGAPLSLMGVRSDLPESYDIGCHQDLQNSSVKTCSFGDTGSYLDVYLVGGSHSAQWLPAFRTIAQKKGLHLVSITKGGCRFFDPMAPGMADYLSESCREWNLHVMEFIASHKPEIVVTLANTRGDESPIGIIAAIEFLVDMDITVIAMRDTPNMKIDPPVCLSQSWLFSRPDCRVPRADILDEQKYMTTKAVLPSEVISVDLNGEICPHQYCDIIRDDLIIWRDSHHLTATFAETLWRNLWRQIAPAFGGK